MGPKKRPSPFLNIGTIIADFHSKGIIPADIKDWYIMHSGVAIAEIYCFKKKGE